MEIVYALVFVLTWFWLGSGVFAVHEFHRWLSRRYPILEMKPWAWLKEWDSCCMIVLGPVAVYTAFVYIVGNTEESRG